MFNTEIYEPVSASAVTLYFAKKKYNVTGYKTREHLESLFKYGHG